MCVCVSAAGERSAQCAACVEMMAQKVRYKPMEHVIRVRGERGRTCWKACFFFCFCFGENLLGGRLSLVRLGVTHVSEGACVSAGLLPAVSRPLDNKAMYVCCMLDGFQKEANKKVQIRLSFETDRALWHGRVLF